MTLDAMGWAVATVLAVALSLTLRYVQVLRSRLPKRDDFWQSDPGPLSDRALRLYLGPGGPFRASPTLDRVQDAFERLIRERDAAKPYMP